MTRKHLIAGNWKMNETIPEAVVLAQEISNLMERDWLEMVDVAVCPPFVDLKPVKTVFEFDRVDIALGAQNVYWEPAGAFTGEISIPMIKEIGCAYCIVGHSERRNIFGETNEDVNRKARALIEAGVTPIICVGESLAVRDEGAYLDFVCAQVRAAYAGIDGDDALATVVAYEPVWAIGPGKTPPGREFIQEVAQVIKGITGGLDVVYGGGLKADNAEMLASIPEIAGGLIALTRFTGEIGFYPDEYIEIIRLYLGK